jgi:hypothetical protein
MCLNGQMEMVSGGALRLQKVRSHLQFCEKQADTLSCPRHLLEF